MLPIVPATNVLTTNDRTCDPITKLFGQLEVSPVEPGALRGLGRQAGGSSYTGDRDADDPHSHSLEYSSENDGGPSNSDAPAGFNSSPPSSVMRMGGESTSDSEGQSPRSCVKGDIEEAPAIDFRTGAYGTTDFEEDDVVESERQIRLTTDSGNEADGYDSSELGESHTSGTSSPRSGSPIQSIYSFHSSVDGYLLREVHGRALNSSNENYMLPADSEEQSRLDLQHAALTLFLGDLYPSPHLVEEVLRPIGGYTPGILDIGTGSGSWALAMARKYPHAEVIGLDLVPPLVALSKIPDNCRFEIDDANLSLSHYTQCFDLVHARAVDFGIQDFENFLYNVAETLRPGGILILGTGDPQFYDENKQACIATGEGRPGFRWIQKFFGATLVAVKNNCEFVHKDRLWTGWLENNPNYDYVNTWTTKMPVGPWPRGLSPEHCQASILFRNNFVRILDSFMPLLYQDGYIPEVAERWKKEAEREIMDLKVHTYANYTWTVSRRAQGGYHSPPLKSSECSSRDQTEDKCATTDDDAGSSIL